MDHDFEYGGKVPKWRKSQASNDVVTRRPKKSMSAEKNVYSLSDIQMT
jgi:hypothetical protein